MIEKVNDEKAIKIYQKHMEKDFPEAEIPSLKRFKKMLEDEKQNVYVFKQDEQELAYFITMEKDNHVLISHLAVMEEFRGKGIGRNFLEAIKEFLSNKIMLIVEVETEKNATNEQEREIIEKRIRYYLKAGFKKCEKITYKLFGIDYYILIYSVSNAKISELEVKQTIEDIYEGLFPKENLKISLDGGKNGN